MIKLFLKTETIFTKPWASVCEGINKYPDSETFGDIIDLSSHVTDLPQINFFVKIGQKVRMYEKDNELFIGISEPVNTGEIKQLGVKKINLDAVKYALDQNANAVYFGYIFNDDVVSQVETVERSKLFGRFPHNENIINFETVEEYKENITAAIWMVFYKIKNTNIYYAVMNNSLIDLNQEIKFKSEDIECRTIDTYDGSFRDSVFNPTLEDAEFVGENLIYTDKDEFIIDMFGRSSLHFFSILNEGSYLDDAAVPNAIINFDSDVKIERLNNAKLKVSLGEAKTAKVSYRWVTGTTLDNCSMKSEELKREFIVIKKQ